jgi:hypothetical protein
MPIAVITIVTPIRILRHFGAIACRPATLRGHPAHTAR